MTTFLLGSILPKEQSTQSTKLPSLKNTILIDCGSWNIRIVTPDGQYICESYTLASDKRTIKSPFERDLLLNFAYLEKLLDQCLSSCLKQRDAKYDLVMTLPAGYPLEEQLKEFLLATYNIFRTISFVPDFMASLRSISYNSEHPEYVLHLGNYSTHVSRVQGSQVQKIYRLNYGATPAAELLVQLLSLKYPGSPMRTMTVPQATAIISSACYCSMDYHQELPTFIDVNKFILKDPNYHQPVQKEDKVVDQKTLEKRKEMGQRLREKAHEKRLERLQSKEEELEQLKALGEDTKKLEKEIMAIKAKIDPTIVFEEEETTYDFALLDVPDVQLDAEQIKEKRRLRLIKASADARERQKLEKQQQEEKQRQEEEADDNYRLTNYEEWRQHKLNLRRELLDKLSIQRKRKSELSGRKGKAARTKLRAIIQDSHQPDAADDGFGRNDGDWDIYKSREAEEEEMETQVENVTNQLIQVEAALEEHDQERFYELLDEEARSKRTVLDMLINETPAGEYWLGVERIRIPEALFQPSIIGQEQCGLLDCLMHLIQPDSPVKLFISGGWKVDGLRERLEKELTASLPQGTMLEINDACNHALSAIQGLALQ